MLSRNTNSRCISREYHTRPLHPKEYNDINCNDNLRNFENSGGNSRGCLMIGSKSGYVSQREWRELTHDGAQMMMTMTMRWLYHTIIGGIGYCVFALHNAFMREFNGCGLTISSVCQPMYIYTMMITCIIAMLMFLAWRNINTRVLYTQECGQK